MAAFSSNIDITNGGTYAMNITNGERYSKVMTDLNNKMSRIQSYLQNNLPETYSSLPTSLPHGKLIIYNNQLYFGNSSSAPIAVFPSSGGTINGDVTITGNLRLKGSGNYGNKLNFGDGDYIYFHENEDDHLTIYSKSGIDFTSLNNAASFTFNGKAVGSGSVSTSDITGTMPISKGGTGATSASSALSNLGAAAASHTHSGYASSSHTHSEYASSSHSHSGYAPKANPVFTGTISMGRAGTTGNTSVAIGYSVVASGQFSYAEGNGNTASGSCSHSEGCGNTASKYCSHAEGNGTEASETDAHAEGCSTIASGYAAHAEGYETHATGVSSHAEGHSTTASNYASHAGGHHNKAMTTGGGDNNTTGDVMVIGNGTSSSSLSNCFRVTYTGLVYGCSSFKTTGADYAEYFEWLDGNPNNEDRVGYFVTMQSNKIKIAQPNDYILGIVSGQPCIIGNADEDWLGRWQRDEYGRFIMEYLEDEKTEISTEELSEEEIRTLYSNPDIRKEDGKLYRIIPKVVDYETPSYRFKANPEYDNTQEYIERKDRKEWSAIGMMGVLSVRDDGTCVVNGLCKVADGGIATSADDCALGTYGTYRVIGRVSDNIIKVVFR